MHGSIHIESVLLCIVVWNEVVSSSPAAGDDSIVPYFVGFLGMDTCYLVGAHDDLSVPSHATREV